MFVYRKKPPVTVEFSDEDQAFSVDLVMPSFDRLLELYQQFGSELFSDADSSCVTLKAGLARALRDMFIDHVRGWNGVLDEDGIEMPYKRQLLVDILNSKPALFLQAISAINRVLASAEEREKN